MRTAVDSSVLLDVIVNDARFADRSEAALRSSEHTHDQVDRETLADWIERLGLQVPWSEVDR